ncbi:MAG: argininosuccinate lyase [SAR202 cluster bacterium]|nr:argininosuccinate lyase [SAR202 cluster bacterium]
MKEVKSSFTVSIHYDRRLFEYDIAGSMAHARMLAKQGIITAQEARAIVSGLAEVRQEIRGGTFPWRRELEDIHMNVERRLQEKIGDAGGKLHTARSRNDQIALDMRLYAKDIATQALQSIARLRKAFIGRAERDADVVLPGYTHVQRGQPVLFGHHMLAYFEMFGRDAERFRQARDRADVMPLGSGALAGSPYPLDRESVAKELGFSKVSVNSMDAVSDRDFLLDLESAAAICMIHLSRLAEELVLWSSAEFGFVQLADDYTTGSSMMPQKRNPDFAELVRGRSGRVIGNLVALLTTLKGLPLTYNRDLQEDKEGVFETMDTLLPCLDFSAGMVETMTLRHERMRQAAQQSYVLATDLADYLVRKGMPFRQAHGVVSRLSAHAAGQGKFFHELSLPTYRRFSKLFEDDVFEVTVDSSIAQRDLPGGTAPRQVRKAVAAAKKALGLEAERVP